MVSMSGIVGKKVGFCKVPFFHDTVFLFDIASFAVQSKIDRSGQNTDLVLFAHKACVSAREKTDCKESNVSHELILLMQIID
jgi:hypothetical protein